MTATNCQISIILKCTKILPHDTGTNLSSRHIARDYKLLNIEVSANEHAHKILEETKLSVSPLAIQTNQHCSCGKYIC